MKTHPKLNSRGAVPLKATADGTCCRLKQTIMSTWKEECEGRGDEKEQRCPQLNMVWLHCDGENDPDRENIGPVRLLPWLPVIFKRKYLKVLY